MMNNTDGEKKRNIIFVPYPINSKKTVITFVFIALNVLMYLTTVIVARLYGWQDFREALWMFGAKVNLCIDEGEYWRLFTCMFLHASVVHLAMNCYALYVYGKIVEKLYGRWRFTVIYLVAGLTGSMLSYFLSEGASVGASGAIFGLFGALLYFGQKRKELFKQIFGWHFIAVVALNLALGLFIPEIDVFGHLGGLVGGYLITAIIGFIGEKNRWESKFPFCVILLLLCCCCMFVKII